MTHERRLLILVLLLELCMHASAAERSTPGTLIVKLAPSSSVARLADELRQALPSINKSLAAPFTSHPLFASRPSLQGAPPQAADRFASERYLVLQYARPGDADAAYAYLQSSSSVEFVQRNYIYTIDAMPNDSAAASQTNLRRIGVMRLWDEGFFAASHPAVKVGVIDTGIDTEHPDLSGAIAVNAGETGTDALGRDKHSNGVDDDGNGFVDDWRGYNFVENGGRGNNPADNNGHGTGVAGIIGATANNRIGIAGIAPCMLVPLRAFDAGGNGTDEDIAAALVYAVDNGCSVVNMSFGVTVKTPVLRDAVRYAEAKHVILVASSGNDGNEKPHYPSDLDGVISVGSVSQYDSRSYFSSYGPPLALLAPGENIVTTAPGGLYTASFSGTSAAAPHVSGTAALVKSVIASDAQRASVPFTNNEFRALLANTAEDIGKPGWETESGAGVVNAYNAVRMLTHNTVEITSPQTDAVLTGGAVAVRGTAVFSGMSTLTVSVGAGEKPDAWTQLASYENRYFFGDTLALWNPAGVQDGIYIIRLAAKSIAGSDIESRIRVLLKRSAMSVTSFTVDDSVLIADEIGTMVRIDTDRPTSASLFFRPKGSAAPFIEKRSQGIQMHHYFLLTSADAEPGVAYELYCSTADNTGAQLPTNAPAQTPTFTIGRERISTTGFDELPYALPAGYLLDAVGTFKAKPTIIMNQYDENGDFSRLKAFSFAGAAFTQTDSALRAWVPRGLADVNGDGVLMSLVQDRGISRVIGSDAAAAKMFARDVFGDSTDVWGSQFYDVDRDGKQDIIARSSNEYLVYKNLGGGKFSLASHLPDPTPPLPGEAKNQFGPPKSLAGDFSGSGKTEIVFADYDGDVLMYRQSAADPFAFSLVWSDTSSLYETSEFLASGDFDGDGIADIASAGHANLDLNEDREYDAPFWTVRIFSHAGTPAVMKKAWERKVAGVRSGFENDNGLSSGAVMPGGEQLLMSLNPYFYIVRYDAASKTYNPAWIANGETNAALVYDFNRNGTKEFGIHAGSVVRFFEHQSAPASQQAPWGVTARQRSEHVIDVRWSSMTPGSEHAVYRDTVPDRFSFRTIVRGTQFIDSSVVSGTTYYYAVAAVNAAEGARSEAAAVKAVERPRAVSVEFISPLQLKIVASAELDRSLFPLAFISADDSITAASVVSASPFGVIATFSRPLASGTHSIRMKRLYAFSGIENDTLQRMQTELTTVAAEKFGIVEAKLVSEKMIRLRFSAPVAAGSLKRSNFTVRTSAAAFEIGEPSLDPSDSSVVVLGIPGPASLTSLGLRVEVSASSDVISKAGIPLNEGKGQIISFGINALSLAHPVVFPNPLRYLTGLQEKITFVNIPVRCKVSIYTAAGHKVREQETLSTPDGLTWDLRSDKGDVVPSGIYIYRLVHVDDNGAVLESTMGKFAIIR
ncbi:MAG: S8 family serine peptidase [Acidobacteriota bacterium]